jgi:hypothetical protein
LKRHKTSTIGDPKVASPGLLLLFLGVGFIIVLLTGTAFYIASRAAT